MKKQAQNRKPELRRETLRQLDPNDLQQVAGGAYYYWATAKYCMGTWYTK